jgi:NNP family nitrate/nitrite transporter-like MFS transporter
LTLVFYLNFIARIIAAPLLPEIEKSLALSHGQAGSFFLCISSGYFIALLCSGFVSTRLGHKKNIVVSLATLSLSLLLLSFSSVLPALQVSFFSLGLAAGMYLPSGIATITELYPARLLGRAFGVHEIAPNLAFLSAPLIAARLLPLMCWQQVFLCLSAVTALAALLYILTGKSAHFKGASPTADVFLELIVLPRFWLMVMLFSMGITATHGVYSVLPMFLVSVHGMDEQGANMLVGLSRSTTLITAFLGGWLADRFGALGTIASVLLLTGLFTVLLAISPNGLLPAWIWLQPLVAVCFFAPAFSILSRIGSERGRSLVVSLAIPLSFVIGGGIVPAGIARMADSGHFSLGLVGAGIFIGSGSVLITLFGRRQQS